MNSYEINKNTVAILPIGEDQSKIIELDNTFIVNMNSMKIIERSCKFFGSTYLGRHEGTKMLTGITHKTPIIIEESRNMIYFPTTSPRLQKCAWFALKHIANYVNYNGRSLITFENGKKLELNLSFGSFDNQFLHATKLESMLIKRKKTID